jgi:hypothetical protein
MPGPRAQQVGHLAAALDRASSGAAPGASRTAPCCAPRAWAGQPGPLRRAGRASQGLGHAEARARACAGQPRRAVLRATGMGGPAGAAAPSRASEPGAGAR